MRLTICLMHVRIQWAVWWGILLSARSQALQHNLLLGWCCGVVCTTSESRGTRAWDLMRTFAVSLSTESQTPWLRGSFIPYLSCPHALPCLVLSWAQKGLLFVWNVLLELHFLAHELWKICSDENNWRKAVTYSHQGLLQAMYFKTFVGIILSFCFLFIVVVIYI